MFHIIVFHLGFKFTLHDYVVVEGEGEGGRVSVRDSFSYSISSRDKGEEKIR